MVIFGWLSQKPHNYYYLCVFVCEYRSVFDIVGPSYRMVHEAMAAAQRRQRSDLSAASNRLIRAVRMRAQYAAEIEAKWLLPWLLCE